MSEQLAYVKATVDIYFDPDHVDCDHCPLMHGWERKQCDRTGEFIIDGKGLGKWCPLDIHPVEETV